MDLRAERLGSHSDIRVVPVRTARFWEQAPEAVEAEVPLQATEAS